MGSNPTVGTNKLQRRLREALDVFASEEGELDPAEVDRLIADARRTSQVIIGTEGAA